MAHSDRHETAHEITISAAADDIYRMIFDVENWPRLFGPTIHVEQIEDHGDFERIHIWATANEKIKNWTSRRDLDPESRRIDFHQEVPQPPIEEMRGTWIVEPISEEVSRVRLLHEYRADDADNLDWLDRAVDANSTSELAALKTGVEMRQSPDKLMLSFQDRAQVDGSLKDAYAFINEAGRWPDRLPHVAAVRFDEDDQGVQTLEMDTTSKDGSTHTTKSYRVTFPERKIVYKQVTMPPLMSLHTGCWSFEELYGGVTVTSQHTFSVNPENVRDVLGANATIADAREYVRSALSTNSRATLGHLEEFAANDGGRGESGSSREHGWKER